MTRWLLRLLTTLGVLIGPNAVAAPQRVVTLEFIATEAVLALGLTPAGAADAAGYRSWVAHPALPASVPDVGTRQEPSLETIATLAPDFILGPALRLKPVEARLNALAPTLLLDGYPKDVNASQLDFMLAEFRKIGSALGRSAEAETLIATLTARLAARKAQLAAAGKVGAVVVAQYLPGTPRLRVFTRNGQVGGVIAALGLTNGWTAPNDVYGFSTVTAEALAGLSAETTVMVIAPTGDAGWQALRSGPLWQALPPIRAGRERSLDPRTWTFGGPVSAQTLGDQISDALLN